MTWIRTVPLSQADESLLRAIEGQRALYPIEYAIPVHPRRIGRDCGLAQSDSAGAVSRRAVVV